MVPGTVLGSYEIISLLGAGGMGEVYRARDTTLGRDVALKLLPAALADDPERVARFQREAQLLASLNHPHIGAIYGLEQSPSGRFLVLELLEGGTLADRVTRGPVPLEEAIEIARQIALALQAAHDKGVVHRDLKPSNVAFTAAGDVKVLDFGLAKLGDGGERPITAASLSPTITSPALMTGVGTLLGTAAYMAPEQAKGKPADKRSDVWAFGCVLYEMLTGTRAFEGDDIADTLANVLKVEPDWSRLPPALPPAISVLLRRCLAKDARQRCGDMAAALILLEESAHLAAGPYRRRPTGRSPVCAAPRCAGGRRCRRRRSACGSDVVGDCDPRHHASSARRSCSPVARDRRTRSPLLLTAHASCTSATTRRSFWCGRSTTSSRGRSSAATTFEASSSSPDGQSVGYIDGSNALMKVALTGGPAIPIARVDAAAARRHVAGRRHDRLCHGQRDDGAATRRGERRRRDRPDTGPTRSRERPTISRPMRLPGGRAVLFTITSNAGGPPQIALLDLETGDRKILVRGGSHARYVESGHLVYAADGVLQAVPFDLNTRTITGTARAGAPAIRDDRRRDCGAGCGGERHARVRPRKRQHRASRCGSIARAARRRSRGRPLMYQTPRLSPDGRRLAFYDITGSGEYDVWILDLERGTVERLTTDLGRDSEPIWSPDSTRIAYLSAGQPGGPGIFIRRADGAGKRRATHAGHTPAHVLVGRREMAGVRRFR